MKTAMQELIDEFRHLCYDKDFHLGLSGIKVTQEIIDGLEKNYLEKEKEQIIKTYWDSYEESKYSGDKTAEEYYNETFNQKETRVFGEADNKQFWSDKPNQNK